MDARNMYGRPTNQFASERVKTKPKVLAPVVLRAGGTLQEALREALEKSGRRVQDLFAAWDTDGDGTVSKYEFRSAIASLGLTPPEVPSEAVDGLFNQFDDDGNGSVSVAEMSKALRRHKGDLAIPPANFANGQRMRHALRSKSMPLPALEELDGGIGVNALPAFDPTGAIAAAAAAAVGKRPVALNVGKLRSQLRGHDVGLDTQMPPIEQTGRRSKQDMVSDAIKRRTAIASTIYSQPDVSHQAYRMHAHAIARLKANGMLHKSASMPAGELPTAHTSPDMLMLGQVEEKPPRKPLPWKRDPRCDPNSRFFPSPNLDHLFVDE